MLIQEEFISAWFAIESILRRVILKSIIDLK